MKSILILIISFFCMHQLLADDYLGLTLIPPDQITNKVDLDVRAGIINKDVEDASYEISLYLNKESKKYLLQYSNLLIKAKKTIELKHRLVTAGLMGHQKIIMVVRGKGRVSRIVKEFKVVNSETRSTKQIDGAWMGLYHWSETEGKHWNADIKKMSDEQWAEMVRSMHKIQMNTIVIQEVFRNEEYVGKHQTNVENYKGAAFYPSKLYVDRMAIAAKDPIEAILQQADQLNMNVFLGVGMFAWFDFTKESLEWHKKVAKELWDQYGHHPSFYGFYVSEESGGSLDNWEKTAESRLIRKKEIVDFFQEFNLYCHSLAPDKPIMLATNSMGVPDGVDTYPALLQNLDILCPFGFARMPEGDLTGKQAADLLQGLCDRYGAHLWFDLETFLFNADQSLYPRPMEEIIRDLTMLDNFEKILCYQFPGVFSDPGASIKVGEERTIQLFKDYQRYLNELAKARKKN